MEAPLGGSAAPAEEMGVAARLFNVFFSPARTFESIARRPGWSVPVVIIVVMALAGSFIITPKLDVDGAVQQQMKQMEKSNPNLTEQQKEQIEERSRKGMEFMVKGPGRYLSFLFVLIPIFLVPALYHGISALWGKSGKYLAVVAAYAHIQLVQVFKGLLMWFVSFSREKIDLMEVATLVKSNVGAFLDPDTTSRPLLALASSIDLFEIWAVVLGCIALPKVTRLTPNGAAFVVIGLWVLWVLIQVGGAALGSLMGG